MNYRVIDSLYSPNDKLGVEMFGISEWNDLKNKVCFLTDDAINGRLQPCVVRPEYSHLFEVLFVPNRNQFRNVLGADAPIDFISSGWASSISKIGSGVTNALNQIPFFTPWIAAGRQVNEGMADILKKLGLSSTKADEVAPTVVKAGLGVGGLLLIGGGIYLVYRMSKKKRR